MTTGFLSALILTFSPGEKEQRLRTFGFANAARQTQLRELSERRQTIPLLLGEKAGMREVVEHISAQLFLAKLLDEEQSRKR